MQPSKTVSNTVNHDANASTTVTATGSGPRRFSDLTPKQQALLRKFQNIGWGTVEDLFFEGGDPIVRPAPKVHRVIRLRGKGSGPTLHSERDFVLRDEHVTFFSFLREQQSGHIHRIEICDGLPAEMSVEEVA